MPAADRTAARMVLVDADIIVERLSRALWGWATYFSCGPVSKAYRTLNRYTAVRLRRWLCRKHKVRYGGLRRFSYEYLYGGPTAAILFYQSAHALLLGGSPYRKLTL